jgi:hypothetical protein
LHSAVKTPSVGGPGPQQPSAAPVAEPQIGESSENPTAPTIPAGGKADNTIPENSETKEVKQQKADANKKRIANGLKRQDTLGKLGIGSDFLGMSVARGKPASDNKLSTKRDSKEVYECTIESLKDGVLDMHSYHRGREGMEPRDPETGELRFPPEPTDTNYDYDAPRMGATVVIEFPLEDETDSKSEENESMDKAMYQETLNWDLADPSTPSPLTFATDIASEYGLSFGQMMDLALSIQQQLDSHIQQNCAYSAPLALKDPAGNERTFVGPTIQMHRFGQVLQVAEGGTRQTRKEGSGRQQRIPSRQPGAPTGSSTARRKSIERVPEELTAEPGKETEKQYLDEVKKRALSASVRDIAQKCKNGIIGVLQKKYDFHCHVCHKRCKVAYSFACGFVSHSYCEMHCKVRKCSYTRPVVLIPDGSFQFELCSRDWALMTMMILLMCSNAAPFVVCVVLARNALESLRQ